MFLTFCIVLFLSPLAPGKAMVSDIEHLFSEQVQSGRLTGNQQNKNLRSGAFTDMTKGYWLSHRTKKYYCIEFKENLESYRWNMTRCLEPALFVKKQADIYEITRQTGTLSLTGNLEADESEGTYAFMTDQTFGKYLADQNISSTDENFMFHLFLADMNKEYVTFLKKNYPQLSGKNLMEVAIHGINEKRFQMYLGLFQKYSHKMPSIDEVIEAKIHGLDENHINQMRASGFSNLSMKKMMETKIHGVDGAYIESLKNAGFTDLTIDKIVEAKIHGITPSVIKEIQSIGYSQLSMNKIIEVKIHGVNAAYIQELKDAGFTDISINKLIEAKIHDVNAGFIQELKNTGFSNLPIDKVIEAKIHGVDGDFIARVQNKGIKPENIDEYIHLKIHGFNKNSTRE